MPSLADLTIVDAAKGLSEKKFSAVDVLKATFERTDAHEETMNSFITQTRELASDQAREVDQMIADRRDLPPLAGIPVAIKDTIVVQGVPATAGSKILSNYVSPYHATAVKRLLDDRAVIVGKTNCDEFAMGASGENSGFGPTKNPWDEARVPGGSSCGSAAAVSIGQALYALGSDTGGSVRQPASFTNLVGLKPTYGRVSRYGLIALASSLDHIGTITRTVDDARHVANVMFGRDSFDATSHRGKDETFKLGESDVKGIRIGVPKQHFLDGMDDGVVNVVRDTLNKLEKRGALIIDVDIPSTKHALPAYYIILPAEASSNLARYDGIRYGLPVGEPNDTLIEQYERTRAAGFGNEVKRRIMLGTHVLSTGYYDAYYKLAQQVRTVIRQEYDAVYEKVDCLIGATSPTPAFKIGEKFEDPLTMYLSDILTVASNVTGAPAISVPAGFSGNLPVGAQVTGKHFDEATIFRVGQAIEEEFKAFEQRPPVLKN